MTERPACPICGKPTMAASRPFCGRRCADVDLGRWFGEAYRVPAGDATTDEQDALAAEDGGT